MKVLIMAGGSGERFWPLSTKEKPKQLLSLITNKSMLRETYDRILKLVDKNDIYIATNLTQFSGIRHELPDAIEKNIIIEPEFRDTAAAIAYGSTIIARDEINPVIVVLASDHLISDTKKFIDTIKIASEYAKNGSIITLGIIPNRPETAYGYIHVKKLNIDHITDAISFMEKPNYETALDYLESGQYVWNSGMFVFRYDTIMSELKTHLPNHIEVINDMKLIIGNRYGIDLCNLVTVYFSKFEKISIDFGVMEKSTRIKCIPVDFGWNDVGGYNSLEEIFPKDKSNNVIKDCRYYYIDSKNNIIISDDSKKLITTIGIMNTIIVNSKNGILVCDRNETQKIKQLLKKIYS